MKLPAPALGLVAFGLLAALQGVREFPTSVDPSAGQVPAPSPPRGTGEDPTPLLERARRMEEQGRMDSAIQLYAAAQALAPDDDALLRKLLDLLVPTGRIDGAVTAYDRAVAARPRDADLFIDRGRFLADRGYTFFAYESFLRASDLEPRSVDARFRLGLVALELRMWSEAEAAFRAAIAIDPSHHAAHRRLGETLLRQERYDLAVPVLAQAELLAPPGGGVIDAGLRGEAYLGLGRAEDGLILFDDLMARTPDQALLHLRRGRALRALGRPRQARQALQRAIELDPTDPGPTAALEDLNRSLERRVTDAVAAVLFPSSAWSRAVPAAASGPSDTPETLELVLARGAAHLAAGRLVGAYEDCLRATELDPRSADAHYQLARVLLELELWSEASRSLRRVIGVDPTHYEGHSRLGWALLNLHRYEPAVPVLARAETLAPAGQTIDAVMRGHCYIEMGRYSDAVGVFERLVRLSPSDAELQFQHGIALRGVGRRADARAAFERTLELDPRHPTAARALQGLGSGD